MTKEDILMLIRKKELEIKKIQEEIVYLNNKYRELDKPKCNYTKEEQIEIFMNYFKGRDNVYPYLSIDKQDPNKKYYIPKCKNEWNKTICYKTMHKKCKDCPYWVDDEIDNLVIENHLFNGKTIGMYTMMPDETCYFLAFDFDNKEDDNDIKDDVLAFTKICDLYNVPISIERSRSGKGFHLWIFFKNKIKAITARKMGSLLLSKTMEIRDSLKIESFDRMFPNQDFLPKGGYGNLIVLPLQTEPTKYGNSVFVDRSFIPFNDQYAYLSSIPKISEEDVFNIINTLSLNTIDIGHLEFDKKNDVKDKKKNNFKFPDKIDVILSDMIYIDKADLSASVKNSFRRLASFANPVFYMKQKSRMSVRDVPMVIDCSKEDEKYIKLPRGTFEYLQILCNENNVKTNIKDKRNNGEKLNISFNGTLREDQSIALKELLKYKTGILEAPTGFGKTVTCCKLIAERKVNTLIIVFSLQLIKQWEEKLKIFLNIDDVGQIGGGKNKVTNEIDIASIKTIYNNGNFNDVVKNYGMIIIDECHHTSAYTYESALNTVNAKYVYGVSATPEKENGHTPIIKMQCGDIRYKVDLKEFNKNLNLHMKVYSTKLHLNFVDKNIADYSLNEIYNFISKDVIRNDKVIKDIVYEFNAGKNILVLTERIEHLEYLNEKLSKFTSNIFVYRGGMGKKILKKYDEIKNDLFQNKKNKIIIATSSCIGEGFDDPTLEVLFLTMPISGINRIIQYTGRLHRTNETKKEIIVYDYIDDNFLQTRNMFVKRKKIYEKLGYEIIDKSFEQLKL